MKIYVACWQNYTDDYYAPHNRRMFLNEKDADKFLDDLINYDGINNNYYIMEEYVEEQYIPNVEIEEMEGGDWECSGGTLHPHTQHTCDCLEMNEEICRSQMEYEYELADKPTAISEEDELKMQTLREKIANQ